ncbi:MAG: hypothetical protein U9R16_05445 [Campylobacterota bacterium]|nr:hypothetical protein [Campylobacterota bacterium]
MKEILDIIVWGGFIFILFIFLRGMNDTQVQKHKEKLEKVEENKKNKDKKVEENKTKGQE